MRAQSGASLAKKAKTSVSFSEIINSPTNRALLDKTLGDSKRATRLVATLVSAVADSEKLKECRPETIISAALKGEAQGLDLSLQQFYLVPYGDACTFIPSHKGLLQLAVRTGQYEELDALDIRQGEYKGRDNATGRPKFEFEPDEEKRESLPIAGYYAYFRLKTGFFKGFYWPMDKLLRHADRYSAAFDLSVYKKFISKQRLTDSERRQVDNGPWYGKTGAQDAMCRKTVLKAMLNSGYAPLSSELIDAMRADEDDVAMYGYEEAAVFAPAQSSEATAAKDEAESTEDERIETLTEVKEDRAEPKEGKPVNAYDMFFGGDSNDDNSEKQ